MDKSMGRGLLIGGITMVAAMAGMTTDCAAATEPKFATVTSVKEAKEKVTTPREVCEDVQVQKQAPVKDENRIAGKVIGGVAGGLLGSTIGGGKGKTVATVAGAAAGAYAGNEVQKNSQQKDVVTTTERRCKTVNETSEKLLGYDVSYRLDGKDGTVRMSYNPGKQIPVKDGQLMLNPPVPKK